MTEDADEAEIMIRLVPGINLTATCRTLFHQGTF